MELRHFDTSLKKECDRSVGWVKRSETQHLQGFEVFGFVPQTPLAFSREIRPTQGCPNLHFCQVILFLQLILGMEISRAGD
jgi:hypothetical protein